MNNNLNETIIIRTASIEDAQELAEIELKCFPPEEAATLEQLENRINVYGKYFRLASRKDKIIGFIDGCVTADDKINDEMYESVSSHQETGSYQTVFGLNVLSEFRHMGLAHKLMQSLIQQSRQEKRIAVILTCKESLIGFYETMGFHNCGVSASIHGGAKWYDMELKL